MSHVRIDEGVKRGKRRPIREGLPTRPAHPADLGTWVIPAGLDPDKVLDQYLTESTTSQIAAQYGLSRKALTKWIREQRPEQWKQAQALRALCTKEDAEDGLRGAADGLSLARARELLKSAQFDLQAIDPDYQPKHHVTVEKVGDLGDRLRRARERVIEPESVVDVQQTAIAAPQLSTGGSDSETTGDK